MLTEFVHRTPRQVCKEWDTEKQITIPVVHQFHLQRNWQFLPSIHSL